MGCKEEAEALLGTAVAAFFEAHNEYSRALEAMEESWWGVGEAINDGLICLAQVEDDDMSPIDMVGMLGCFIDVYKGGRKAGEARAKAKDQRDVALETMKGAIASMERAGAFYCECIRNQPQSSIDPEEIQQMIDEALDAVADLEGVGDDMESDLDELDVVLDELEDAIASIEEDDSDAALVA